MPGKDRITGLRNIHCVLIIQTVGYYIDGVAYAMFVHALQIDGF